MLVTCLSTNFIDNSTVVTKLFLSQYCQLMSGLHSALCMPPQLIRWDVNVLFIIRYTGIGTASTHVNATTLQSDWEEQTWSVTRLSCYLNVPTDNRCPEIVYSYS